MGSLPAWWENDGRRQNARSRRQERKRAEEAGGRPQPGSGSSWRAPQDVRTEHTLEQVKYTDKHSFTIDVREWLRLVKDAENAGRDPLMLVEFAQHGVRLIITPAPDGSHSA